MLNLTDHLLSAPETIDYVEQRVSNLEFYLYEGRISPSYFQIFRQSRLKRCKYEAEFWIIGSSHVVIIETENDKLTEIVSADQGRLPSSNRIYHLSGLQNGQFCYPPYQISLELRGFDCLALFESEFRQLVDCKFEFRLQQMFPRTRLDGTGSGQHLPPSTIIDIFRADDAVLNFRTLNTYTEEMSIAITNTQVRLPE